MKIFVIGTGATGSVLINTLAKSKGVDFIYCLSRDTKDKRIAKQFIKPDRKVKIFSGDIKKNSRNIEKISKRAPK